MEMQTSDKLPIFRMKRGKYSHMLPSSGNEMINIRQPDSE